MSAEFYDIWLTSQHVHNMSTTFPAKDFEDEKFWKAIYCLLRAVFPALKALRYCDANFPAMDKNFYLANRANDAILKSAKDFDDVEFGTMQVPKMNGTDFETTKVFGEKPEFERDNKFFIISFNLNGLTFFLFSVKIQMTMTQTKKK